MESHGQGIPFGFGLNIFPIDQIKSNLKNNLCSFSALSEMISIPIERMIVNLEERMRVSERVTQVFLRAFRLPGRQQLQAADAAAAAAVPAGELVVTAQLPFAAVPLPAAPLLQIGRQLCTQTPQLRRLKCDQTP